MNGCEEILMAHAVKLQKTVNESKSGQLRDCAEFAKNELLDCLVEMRYPTSEPLESGCGKLVSAE